MMSLRCFIRDMSMGIMVVIPRRVLAIETDRDPWVGGGIDSGGINSPSRSSSTCRCAEATPETRGVALLIVATLSSPTGPGRSEDRLDRCNRSGSPRQQFAATSATFARNLAGAGTLPVRPKLPAGSGSTAAAHRRPKCQSHGE